MKIQIDAALGVPLPEDSFVSVCIGESRKLSHFVSSRTYSFPDRSGKDPRCKYGHVEVYRRVGSSILDLEELDGAGAQDIDVSCNEPGLQPLSMQVSVGNRSDVDPAKQESCRYWDRMEAVQQYIAKHNIEQLVADSLGNLLKDQPEDPREMLPNYVSRTAMLPPLQDRPLKSPPFRPKSDHIVSAQGQQKMKIHLDAAPGVSLPSHTFVAIRIGEVRKLSHFVSSRTYSFLDRSAKDPRCKYGHVEVYRRIGSGILDLEELDGAGAQEINVSCKEPGLQPLIMQVSVGNSIDVDPAERESRQSRYWHRMEAVKTYIAKHNIEQLVAESVGKLLKDKPDDPRKMLPNYVAAYGTRGGLLPPIQERPLDTTFRPMDVTARPKSGASMRLPPLALKDPDPMSQTATQFPTFLPPEDVTNIVSSVAKPGSWPAVQRRSWTAEEKVDECAGMTVPAEPDSEQRKAKEAETKEARLAAEAAQAAKMEKRMREAEARQKVRQAAEEAAATLRLKPSVGTWAMQLPPVRRAVGARATAQAALREAAMSGELDCVLTAVLQAAGNRQDPRLKAVGDLLKANAGEHLKQKERQIIMQAGQTGDLDRMLTTIAAVMSEARLSEEGQSARVVFNLSSQDVEAKPPSQGQSAAPAQSAHGIPHVKIGPPSAKPPTTDDDFGLIQSTATTQRTLAGQVVAGTLEQATLDIKGYSNVGADSGPAATPSDLSFTGACSPITPGQPVATEFQREKGSATSSVSAMAIQEAAFVTLPRPPSTASKVSTAGDTADAPEAVAISLTVQNVDYATVTASKELLGAFTTTVKETLAREAGVGVLPDHVQVVLAKGSILINAKITPPGSSKTATASLQAILNSSKTLTDNMTANVKNVPGIENATTGPIYISDIVIQKAEDASHETIVVITEATSSKANSQQVSPGHADRNELIRSVLEDAEACASTSEVQVERMSDYNNPDNLAPATPPTERARRPHRIQPGEIKKSVTGMDMSMANPLQQLHFQTIRELVRERDDAVVKATTGSQEEREAMEARAEMLELALQEARAEYVANYDEQPDY